MVKGISKRVIVVRSPDRRLFEQAIFIIKDDVVAAGGVSAQQVVDEALRVADGYVKKHRKGKWKLSFGKIPAPVFAVAGAGATALAWGLSILL